MSEFLVLEMYYRHMDETDLSEDTKEAFKIAFHEVVSNKIEAWLNYYNRNKESILS